MGSMWREPDGAQRGSPSISCEVAGGYGESEIRAGRSGHDVGPGRGSDLDVDVPNQAQNLSGGFLKKGPRPVGLYRRIDEVLQIFWCQAARLLQCSPGVERNAGSRRYNIVAETIAI